MNILVTGGASGLGGAITKTLAGVAENKVWFTYNSSKENAGKIESEFENTFSIKCDFTVHHELIALQDQIKSMDLDVLVNNAYCSKINYQHFHKTPPDSFLSDFKDNILPTVTITREVIKHMRKKRQGKIITILSSLLLNVPPIGLSMYLANKAYLEKLTKVWASENSTFNITSNSISPSFMRTALTDDVDERIIEEMINNHPLKRLVTPKEVAEAVLFLVNSSNQINGVDLVMNAGVNLK